MKCITVATNSVTLLPTFLETIYLKNTFLFPDCSLEYALEAASLHPAKALGIDDRKGKLDFGYDADFVILHPKSLKVLSTWIAGECVYKRPNNASD